MLSAFTGTDASSMIAARAVFIVFLVYVLIILEKEGHYNPPCASL
tara:strand:- start:250 stop:384 length:135 start_codon:yes stop_codon:yes gene_type:complete